jgi:hypothetical protein
MSFTKIKNNMVKSVVDLVNICLIRKIKKVIKFFKKINNLIVKIKKILLAYQKILILNRT